MTAPTRPCHCGHSKLGHLQGEGLCLHCSRPMCLIFREVADARGPASTREPEGATR